MSRRGGMRAAVALALLAAGCGSDGSDPVPGGDAEADGDVGASPDGQPAAGAGVFSSAITDVVVEVDYEPGAEPYTSFRARPGSPWSLFRGNAERLFAEASPRELHIPEALDEMQSVGDLELEDFRAGDILALAAEHRQSADTDTEKSFYVIFVDGYFATDAGRQTQVLGVSIGDTGVIAMFKPVIATGGVADRFVEQSTMIHEFGHAIGMVNRGLPMTSEHHDDEHGAHCTNEDCVMYYQVEGASDVLGFAMKYLSSDEVVVVGPECLADADAAGRAGR